jgi:hypothetical protein
MRQPRSASSLPISRKVPQRPATLPSTTNPVRRLPGGAIVNIFTKGEPLARSNYKFEKRQKEIAKKKKKEEKFQRKQERQQPAEAEAENTPPSSDSA